ncbi:MAG: hypothetical protein J1F65_05850 [Clostridiales bacterium]|nr:hypothetical protein [Clostridiales bacterium]
MPYHYEETDAFMESVSEVERLVDLAKSDDVNRDLFLKLAMVSLVTKFQVFVQQSLSSFRESLVGIRSKKLTRYSKMNSLYLAFDDGNPLLKLKNRKDFSENSKEEIVKFLKSIDYITNDEAVISDEFKFNCRFPLGKTGKKELISLLKQIKGDENPFSSFVDENLDQLNSILQKRHTTVHSDRLSGTEESVTNDINYIKALVKYIDDYLFANKVS